jgi:8-oxo-dGTP pyrophosphatase MutT (NUDIX family)
MLQSVAVMIFDDLKRLLLAQDAASGIWMTIGGAIDPDEAPANAAVRECWEETGLLVQPVGILGVFGGPEFRVVYQNGDVVSYVVTAFVCRRVSGTPYPDGSETAALRFASRDEAATLPMASLSTLMVERAFEYEGASYFAKPNWQPNHSS